MSARYRSPPRTQRRDLSPRDRDVRRAYSPPREPRSKSGHGDPRRQRTLSPAARRPAQQARMPSPTTSSRRSSPPMHPDRMTQSQPIRPTSPSSKDSRSQIYPLGATQMDSKSLQTSEPFQKPVSPRERANHRPLPRNDREEPPVKASPLRFSPPSRPARLPRPDEMRPVPTQPSAQTENTSRQPPSGPAAYRQPPTAPQGRASTNAVLSAPTRPRGGPSYRAESRDTLYEGPAPTRGGRSGLSHQSRHPFDPHGPPTDRAPSGPRAGIQKHAHVSFDSPRAPFRVNTSTSATYPRSQRFTNHLAALAAVIPGGKALPPFDPAANRKLSQLEEDASKLRKQIDERQKDKRAALRDWERRERESKRENLRSELAEAQLQSFSGEVIGGQAF